MNDLRSIPLDELVSRAWSLKSEFDLRDVGYGRIHWGNLRDFLKGPFSYYYFLAGMVRLTGARKILEIGTHQGGSTKALCKGLVAPSDSRVVTFDVTPYGSEIFSGDPVVRAFTMDANTESALEKSLQEFGGSNIDLAFIDSTHDFWTTFQSISLYTSAFKCPVVIIDDITLNPSMAKLWDLLRKRYGTENAIDATDVNPEIRTGGSGTRPGFGVIRLTT